jgi:molecular chaperone GrpE
MTGRSRRFPVNGRDDEGGAGGSGAGPSDVPSDAGAVFSDDGQIDPELEQDLGAEYEVFEATQVEAEQSRTELEEARREAAEFKDLALRRQAELDNYRKRMRAEQADAVARAGERIASELLPVIDNLERAIDQVTAGGEVVDLLKGVEMVHGQLLDVLAKEGVELQDPFGKPFDPERHQAVAQREDAETPEGTVVEVYQKGYVMHGRVIRPAQVVVSTGGPAPKE